MSTHDESVLTVEAPTAEEALLEVSAAFGVDAEILSAEKVARGGIGGFFSKEMVQIRARHRDVPSTREGAEGKRDVGGATTALQSLRDEVDAAEAEFAGVLRRRLGADPGSGDGSPMTESRSGGEVAGHEEPGGMTSPVDAPTRRSTPVRLSVFGSPAPAAVEWSVRSLLQLGLPGAVAEAAVGLDPDDELGWLSAIAGAVTPNCRPLPQGSQVIAGRRADRLAIALAIPVFRAPEAPPYGGTFAAPVDGRPDHLEWLDRVRGERAFHLVVDDDPSHGLLTSEPVVVSWTSTRGVVEAIRLSATLGAVLGYGMDSSFGAPAWRAHPLDVALTIRSLMGRRR